MTNIEKFISEMEANGLSKKTIQSQKSIMTRLDNYFNPRDKDKNLLEEYKPLDSITPDELKVYFKELKTKMTESTFALHQIVIKKFFMQINKSDIVDWIVRIRPKETLKSDDILSTDDINKMLEATESHYYKAYISFLFETGCRFSEAHSLKYKDFIETTDGMIVNIPTNKTNAGFRKTILPFSSQYIRNLKMYVNPKPDDIVFTVNNCQSNSMLHQVATKAEITKPVNCHKMRHAQATAMVQLGYNEAIIRKKLGWSPTSSMIARYQHLNDDDVINATLSNTGKMPKTAVRVEMKEAEKLTLVDASQQFSKLSDENAELKEKVAKLENNFSGVENTLNDMLSIIIESKDKKSVSKMMEKMKDVFKKEVLVD